MATGAGASAEESAASRLLAKAYGGLASLISLFIVVAIGLAALYAPKVYGDADLFWVVVLLSVLFCLGLWWSSKLNAEAGGSADHKFDETRFNETQQNEAALVLLIDQLGKAQISAVAANAAAICSKFEQLREAGALQSPADIVNVVLNKLGVTKGEPKQYYERIVAILERLQARIGEEYTDTHTRTGWLMTAQAFLLTGFVTVLNAENVSDSIRNGFKVTIPVLGALVAMVLSFAIFHGHALIDVLKRTRLDVEAITRKKYAIPATGVTTRSRVHLYGHLATKALPSAAFVGWIVLLGVVRFQPERFATDPDVGAQLVSLGVSPAFAWGESRYDAERRPCPVPSVALTPDKWADAMIERWTTRPSKSTRDGLWLVGSTDRTPLSKQGVARYGSDAGLARARIATVSTLLLQAAERRQLTGVDALYDSRIFLQANGPIRTPVELPKEPGDPGCGDPAITADRSVGVWLAIR